MALTVSDILPEVRTEIGDLTGDLITDAQITDYFIPAALTKMNAIWPQVYAVVASTFSPDPTTVARNDKRPIVIFVSLQIASYLVAQAVRDAVYHSDVAGATDMRESGDKQVRWRGGILDELQSLYDQRVQRQAEGDVAFVELRRSYTAYGT